MLSTPIAWALTFAFVLATLSTYQYVATAIAFRGRDNGLSFVLLVLGVGVWNAMTAVQLLSPDGLVQSFFLSVASVGALLAGLGWFLFAATASSTPFLPSSRLVYGFLATLVSVDAALALTAPVHGFYWTTPASAAGSAFAVVVPRLGYWLHTQLLVVLFGAGTLLFAAAWRDGTSVPYTRAYTIAGTATTMAIVGSNVLAPGGLTVAPPVAASLTSIGWVQARRGQVFERIRSLASREGGGPEGSGGETIRR